MKAAILLGTLKKFGLSNTETLCEFLTGRMEREGIRCETIKLVGRKVLPGTYSDMGESTIGAAPSQPARAHLNDSSLFVHRLRLHATLV